MHPYLNQVNSEGGAAEQTRAWNACSIMRAHEAREARATPAASVVVT